MKKVIFAAILASISATAFAEVTLWGGQPQVVYEIEHERVANQGGRANALTLYPGIRWKEGWINQAELMLTHEHEVEYADGDVERANNQKFAVRVKKCNSQNTSVDFFVPSLDINSKPRVPTITAM